MASSNTSAALTRPLTLDEVVDLIRDGVTMAGSQKNYAGFVGIHPALLNHVLRGQSKPGKRLLAYLGLQAVTVYRRTSF